MNDKISEAVENAVEEIEEAAESEVADLEAALEEAETRADAAEEARDLLLDAQRRDALYQEVEKLRGECETWRSEADRRMQMLSDENATLRQELATVREEMTRKVTVSLTPQQSASSTPTLPEPATTPEAITVEVEPAKVEASEQSRAEPIRKGLLWF